MVPLQVDAQVVAGIVARWTGIPLGKMAKDEIKTVLNHKAVFSHDDALVDAVLARCTEVDSGARNVDHILNGTLLPEIAESVLAKMAEGTDIASIKVSANLRGQFKYVIQSHFAHQTALSLASGGLPYPQQFFDVGQ